MTTAFPTPGVTPANWGAQLNAAIQDRFDELPNTLRVTPKVVVGSGKYWILAGQGAVGTVALVNGTEVAIPFEILSPVTISELDVEVTTAAASSVVRLGIRAHDPLTGEPAAAAPLVDAGTVDSTTTGVKTAAVTPNLVLQPGWYWYTVTAQGGAPTVRSSNPWAVLSPVPSKASAAATIMAFNVCGYSQTGVAGALPSTWTSSPNLLGAPRMIAKHV